MSKELPVLDAPRLPRALLDGPIYLDHNATTPVDPRVAAAATPYLLEHFGNPSSAHGYGHEPKRAVSAARQQVAELIGASANDIIFTGSGTEADALAVLGVVGAALRRGVRHPHVVTQSTEHPAVIAACAYAERHLGAHLTVLPVDSAGLVSPAQLASATTASTVLVSVMHANNETGVIQPIAELARITHDAGAVFHTDAAQSVGKVALHVELLGVDLLTLVGHKMYAPKGIGALYHRPGVELDPILPGGGQEGGLRGGTENVAAIVALGAAAGLASDELAAGGSARLAGLRDRLLAALSHGLPGRIQVNGTPGLPQTLSVSIAGTRGLDVLARCPQVAASTGSACHSGTDSPSGVLLAMGQTPARAMSTLRLSMGRWTTEAEVDAAAAALVRAVLD